MEHQFPVSKRSLPANPASALNLSASFPRSNWPLDDWYHHQHQQQQQHNQLPTHHHHHHHQQQLRHAPIPPASAIAGDSSHLEEAMWPMMKSPEERDYTPGPFPERPGEPDCPYYMRTGNCGFGMSCRFNHPPNRNLVAALARDRGEYPERPGQPECQYFLKTGNCKFGLSCKFHHPKERAGSLGKVSMNSLGLPLRPGEKDCAYYVRTGACKFGSTCKFNHPQSSAYRGLVAMTGSSMYTSTVSPSAPSAQPFPTGMPSWSVSRASFVPGSRFQSPSSFASVIVPPQSLVSVPGWSTYQVQMGPMTSLDGQQRTLGTNFVYGGGSPSETLATSVHPSYSPYVAPSTATGLPSVMQSPTLSKDTAFPERPGQLECQYYMKTGDCKFGLSCRFDHPKERVSLLPNCILSPMGLPLRPGVTQCAFYMRYGICKFGPTCKFDHPVSSLTYSPSASSLTDMPVSPYPMGFSVAAFVPPSPESSFQGPKIILKDPPANAGVELSYLNGNVKDGAQNNATSSNRPSSSGSDESRGNSGDITLDSSL